MRRYTRTACLATALILFTASANAQRRVPVRPAAPSDAPASPPLRVVVHVLDVSHLGIVYALQNIAAAVEHADPTARFVVVVTGAGVMFLRQSEPNNVSTLLSALIATGRVDCRIDGVSLARADAPAADVLPGTTIVPSGLLEIARLQREGYVYILE